jgi:hypothetical protein
MKKDGKRAKSLNLYALTPDPSPKGLTVKHT